MDKHLIVISVDAMVYEDLEYCRSLPNLGKLINNGSIIEHVRTIYPSLTHPVHATLITGCTAGRTGIVNNSIFDKEHPIGGADIWYNYLEQIGCDTLLHVAKRAGLTTAVASWPVTNGMNGVIDYLVPCALNVDFDGYEDSPLDAYRALGASESIMDIIEEAVNRHSYINKHPEVDDFQAYCSAEIIKRYKPNLLLTHPSYVDDIRHKYGVFSPMIKHALDRTDEWIGMIMQAVEEAGIADTTDYVILSDHGQISITRTISPNVYLCDEGFITANEDGSLKDYTAFIKSAGASAHVYLKDSNDRSTYDRVYALLQEMANEGIYGFNEVLKAEEVKEIYGLYGDFSFVLETDGYTSFGEWLTRPVVRPHDINDYRFGKGTHGHLPHKGPQPIFLACGASFKRGVVLEYGEITSHAPTLASVLGLELKDAEGRIIKEFLK